MWIWNFKEKKWDGRIYTSGRNLDISPSKYDT